LQSFVKYVNEKRERERKRGQRKKERGEERSNNIFINASIIIYTIKNRVILVKKI